MVIPSFRFSQTQHSTRTVAMATATEESMTTREGQELMRQIWAVIITDSSEWAEVVVAMDSVLHPLLPVLLLQVVVVAVQMIISPEAVAITS